MSRGLELGSKPKLAGYRAHTRTRSSVFCDCTLLLSTIIFPPNRLTPISETHLNRGPLLVTTRDCSTSLARTCVSVTLFSQLAVKGHYCRVGAQELELPLPPLTCRASPLHIPVHRTKKKKEEKIQATAMAWKSGER